MKDQFKKKFPGLGQRRTQYIAFCDLFQSAKHTGDTKRGYNYYLLIGVGQAKTVHGYGLKTKDEASDALADLFIDVCVPEKVVTDGGGECTGEAWEKQPRAFHTTKDVTEADHQNQNFSERNNQTVKNMVQKLLDQT